MELTNGGLLRPAVGVGILVIKDDRVLIGEDRRKGNGVMAVCGGHWESYETLSECAIRETREESGVLCKTPRLISVYDFYRLDKKRRYVSIGMSAEYESGEPADNLDEGRFGWRWCHPDEALDLNLFEPDRILITRYLSGVVYE